MKDLHKTHPPSTTNRQPEKWFRRLLWVVAFIFAGFLIGLGGKIVADLPLIHDDTRTLSDFVEDQATYQQLQKTLDNQKTDLDNLEQKYDTAKLTLDQQHSDVVQAEQGFKDWLATRSVTEQSSQNPQVIKRTHELDALRAKELSLQKDLQAIESQQLGLSQAKDDTAQRIDQLETQAQNAYESAQNKSELIIFLYRLAITLPLLILAWYLFSKHRHGKLWPFVWGFVFFALFAFFVELVPYLPSYGGYVHYVVGIVLTFVIGRYGIIAMNHYLERKKSEETLSISERQSTLNYDQAQAKLAKEICPSCERKLALDKPDMDFCPHCGICLFLHCQNCTTRNSAFNHYCHKCGNNQVHS